MADIYSLIRAKEASESLTIYKTQEWLFRDLGTKRSSSCSTSTSIQSLEKSSVATQQNFFYFDPSPLHWTYCLLYCVLTPRECLLTRVNRTKTEDDPGLEQHRPDRERGGAPEAVDPWQRMRPERERSEATNSTGVIMDSHIWSIKVWWETGYGSSLAREVENLVWSEALSEPVTLCLVAGAWSLCWGFWRLPQVTVYIGWKHMVSMWASDIQSTLVASVSALVTLELLVVSEEIETK